jgi:type II secretory pathway pseudopilin PulG
MKNVLIVILLVAAVALGGFVIQKNQKAAQAEAKRVAAEKALQAVQAAKTEQEQNATALREKLEAAQMESAANAGTAAQLSKALTNLVESGAAPEATNAKPANPLTEMFKNPEMREMIKNQQKTVLGTMVDKNYAEFFKSMNLTPEQTTAMKDLILNKMLGNADLGMEMIGGDMDAAKRAELTKKMKENNDALDAQIKAMLGDENYSLYQTYEKSIPDRMAVSQLKDQLGADLALNANQEQLLVSAMSDERQNFKFTTDFSNQQDFSEDMFSKFTEERMNLYFQEQDQLNQKYLARAQTILSADQYAAYAKSLKNQQEMMKMGMKMAVQMFGNKK